MKISSKNFRTFSSPKSQKLFLFIFFIRYIDIPVKNCLFRNQKHKNTKSPPYRSPWRCCLSGTVVSYRFKVPSFQRIFMVCIYMHVQYQCNFLFTVLFTNRFFRRIAFWTSFQRLRVNSTGQFSMSGLC